MAPVSTLSFKCALITGGGGGLGRAMAEALIAMGKSVIIAGRTEAGLKKTAAEIGAKAYFVLDVSNIPSISGFVKDIVSQHPELDCIINNAGVQRPFQILGPDYGFDLNQADQEIDTNIRGPMHLGVSLVWVTLRARTLFSCWVMGRCRPGVRQMYISRMPQSLVKSSITSCSSQGNSYGLTVISLYFVRYVFLANCGNQSALQWPPRRRRYYECFLCAWIQPLFSSQSGI